MYAVVKTGGKQVQVSPGDTVRVEKLSGEPGETVQLNEILLLSDGEAITLGRPFVEGAMVTGEIVEQGKHRKVIVYKFKRRKRYRRKAGHRQEYTALKITGITGIPDSVEQPEAAQAE